MYLVMIKPTRGVSWKLTRDAQIYVCICSCYRHSSFGISWSLDNLLVPIYNVIDIDRHHYLGTF